MYFPLGDNIHVDPADQMAEYNKWPIANVIRFSFKYFYHLDVEIIVNLHTQKLF